jgi:hypothetical protein
MDYVKYLRLLTGLFRLQVIRLYSAGGRTLHNEVLRLSSGNALYTVEVSVVGVEYL